MGKKKGKNKAAAQQRMNAKTKASGRLLVDLCVPVSVTSGCHSLQGSRPHQEDRVFCACCFETKHQHLEHHKLLGSLCTCCARLLKVSSSGDAGNGDDGESLLKNKPLLFFGVFDGHGGAEASQFISKHLPHQCIRAVSPLCDTNDADADTDDDGDGGVDAFDLRQGSAPSVSSVGTDASVAAVDKKWKQALRLAHSQTERSLHHQFHRGGRRSCSAGSTSATVLVRTDCWVAFAMNVGDSRIVMARNGMAIPLSFDQTAANPEERKRLRKLGVPVDKQNRVWSQLSVSRVFGDFDLKRSSGAGGDNGDGGDGEDTDPLFPTPVIRKVPLYQGDECMILASDGVWDVVSNQDAVDVVLKELKKGRKQRGREHRLLSANGGNSDAGAAAWPATLANSRSSPPAVAAAQALVEFALFLGSKDNVSAVVIEFECLKS